MNLGPLTLLALTSALAQLPPSPDPKPMPISGIIVDGSGAPVAGADVWLAEAVSPADRRRAGAELLDPDLISPGDGTTQGLARTRADAAGRFALEVPAEAVARHSPVPMAIWAAVTGKDARVSRHRLPRILLADDPPVRIELAPPAHNELTVLGPDRKPVAGARVIPIRAGEVPIPEPLGRSITATTDSNGRATLASLAPATLAAVRVDSTAFGAQTLEIRDHVTVLTLAPVGRVVGRLVPPANELIRGVTIRATTQVGGYAGSGQAGSAAVACDSQGRFEIPAIAAGMLTLELEFDREKARPLRGEAPSRLMVRPGRVTDVTIPLRATLSVHGLAREKGTERPIAGLGVMLNGQFGGDALVVTDAQGKYSGRIVREVNQPMGWPMPIASPFFVPADLSEVSQAMPPRGSDDLPMPPIELPRGVDVKGSVASEDGKPVAGAEVEATWTAGEAAVSAVLARTDRTGAFTLHGVDPLAELSLTAWDGFASTAEVTVRAEAAIALTISPRNTAHLGGRVVDSAGKPIAGASVRIWRQARDKSGPAVVVDPIAAEDGSVVLHTDADGRYRTRRRFPAHATYYAEAAAPGRLVARSPAVAVASESDKPVALVLRGVRTVEGRVVDRQGQPVAGAVVRQSGDGPMPTESPTADDGRFQLPGVLEGPALIFAEEPGYRFGFLPVDGGSQPVEVVLARAGEPPSVAYHTLPPALPIEEEKALARRLIAPSTEKILQQGNDDEKFQFLRDAITIDPVGLLERLASIKFADAEYLQMVRIDLASALAREDLDEATALLEASDTADVRAWGYLGICDILRDLPPPRLREFLAQAAVNARGMTSPMDRIRVEAQIAEHWLDLGETERARNLLQAVVALGQNTIKGIKDGGYNLGLVAEGLARIDLPAALEIIDDLERDARKNEEGDRSYIFERCLGHIAFKVAGQSLADAERVLVRIPIKQAANRYVAAVCSRMAPKDLARACRIAETRISRDAPGFRPYALGLMARALAATDRAAAIRLIDEAYDVLGQLADIGDRPTYPGLIEVAEGLLPMVEQVEPDRLGEFLGRTLALRLAQDDQTDNNGALGMARKSGLVMMVARYDRPLAARLLEPELHQIGGRRVRAGMDESWRVLAALALIDPRRAVEQVEALPDDPAPGTTAEGAKSQARIYVAKMLALHGTERWNFFYQYFLNLWTPDQWYL